MIRIHMDGGHTVETSSVDIDAAVNILSDPDGVSDVVAAYPSEVSRVVVPRRSVVKVVEVTER